MFSLSRPLRKSTCSRRMAMSFISPLLKVPFFTFPIQPLPYPLAANSILLLLFFLLLLVLVHASVPANTFAIYGNGEDKELTELVPGILNQLGPDSLASLRKLAESYQSLQKKEGGDDKKEDEDDDDIPDLVAGESFEAKAE
ncbi:Nascent polypeptide-associated complex subunit beta [Orbilia javanica]|uniref:Nascent polypeptide-associated complex subunit beta n=1 Tax=Orbilia javanica TaxID=47235 RepID=A0AAN8MW13_9PEZI